MSEIHQPEIVTLDPRPAALLRETVPMGALPDFFGRAFHAAAQAAGTQGVQLVGPPVGVYFGMPSDTVDVAAGFPTDRAITPDAGVVPFTLPGGRAVRVLHVGSYDAMQETYGRLMAWMGAERLTGGPVMWEEYLTEPDPAAPDAAQTLIVWPLA